METDAVLALPLLLLVISALLFLPRHALRTGAGRRSVVGHATDTRAAAGWI
jgi:hypothetical protein